MSGLAASGGYYVAAPCQWIVFNELLFPKFIDGAAGHSDSSARCSQDSKPGNPQKGC
ncbi:hypothetical protein OAH36_04770 [Verrucomicrobia bacterium]|nr:hypothetical protein [Verrucomicrobiota bacterium]